MPAQQNSHFHASWDWLVSPWYGAITIDAQEPPSDSILARPSRGFVACQGSKLVIFTGGEDNLRVRVRVESWSGEPVIADDHAEIGPETCELTTPSGVITVSDSEASVNRFELPGPGTYHVRVTGHGMDAAELYHAAESRSTDFEDAQFQADWALLQGRETYIMRLWPAT